MPKRLTALLCCSAARAALIDHVPRLRDRVDPAHAINLTLYHVNPLSEGVIPVDMDTSDLPGDIFFDLRSVVLPVECASEHAWSGDCDNQELTGDDLVISKLVVEADDRLGTYGMCNICGPDCRDPLSGLRCTPGEYFCTCHSSFGLKECGGAETRVVGRENITETFGKWSSCTWDEFVVEPWACWSKSVFRKTGGEWYSTFAESECAGYGSRAAGCAWRVLEVSKVVNKTCSDASIYGTVERHDTVDCFDACPKPPGQARNTSSPCWIGCFYRTILGAEGMLPTGADHVDQTGLPYDVLARAWDAPFSSDDPVLGGCAAIPV